MLYSIALANIHSIACEIQQAINFYITNNPLYNNTKRPTSSKIRGIDELGSFNEQDGVECGGRALYVDVAEVELEVNSWLADVGSVVCA